MKVIEASPISVAIVVYRTHLNTLGSNKFFNDNNSISII